jgi:hypothetical protein
MSGWDVGGYSWRMEMMNGRDGRERWAGGGGGKGGEKQRDGNKNGNGGEGSKINDASPGVALRSYTARNEQKKNGFLISLYIF